MLQSRRAGLLVTVFSLAAAPAFAADVSAAQATVVEQQIADWLRASLGAAVTLPDRPVQLTAESTDYAVAIPLGGVSVTGKLTPSSDGLWRLSDLRIPSPSTFTISMPMPGKTGEPPKMVPTTYQVSIGSQTTEGVFDPSYKQASTLTQSYTNMQVSAEGGGQQQTTTVASSNSTARLAPLGGGRFDLTTEGTISGYSADTHLPSGVILHIAAQSGKVSGKLRGVSGEHGPALLQASIRLIADTMAAMNRAEAAAGAAAGPAPGGAPPPNKAVMLQLVNALDGLASSGGITETLSGVQVQVAGHSGSAAGAHVAMGGTTPNGLLSAYLDIGVDGLSLPDLPLGPFADLVPKAVELRPVLSGVSTQALVGTMRAGLQDGAPPPDFAALFKAGPISVGLEKLAFDMGPSAFTGHGSVTFASPTSFTGSGQVTATNLDALIQRASTDPAMRPAFAVLTIAKGIGHTNGAQTVWDITYQNGKALVNGVDVMAMAGGSRRPVPPRAPVMPIPVPRAPVVPAPVPQAPVSKPIPHMQSAPAPGLDSGKPAAR